jgi:hypothetical protein
MKARSGIKGPEAIRMLPKDLTRGIWTIFKGTRALGMVQWRGAVPFAIRMKSSASGR